MTKAASGNTVQVHYKGTLADGTVFDSSHGREPLQFTIGSKAVIAGFEGAVIGMAKGETKTVVIPPDEAYGHYREEMVQSIPRNQVPPDIEPEVGMRLQVQTPSGGAFPVTIRDVTEESITLDGNPPLAGKELTFEIELVSIA